MNDPSGAQTVSSAARPASVSLRRSFSFTLVSNLVFAASQWVVISAIARMGSTEDVGHYALGLAIASPVLTLLNLSLRPFQVADRAGRYSFSEYSALRFITAMVAAFVIVGIALTQRKGGAAAIVVLVGMGKVAESFSDIAYGAFQQREVMQFVTLSMIVRSAISLIAALAVMWWTRSVALVALATLVGWSVWACVDLWYAHRLSESRANSSALSRWPALRMLAREALPLALAGAVLTLNANMPRYAIEKFLGSSPLGIFAAVSYVFIPMTTVANALGQAVSPRLALHVAGKEFRQFRLLLLKLVGIGTLIGATGLISVLTSGRLVLRTLYGSRYEDATVLLAIVMVAGGVSTIATFLGYASNALREYDRYVLPYCALALFGSAITFGLVRGYGVDGAGWALVFFSIGNALVAGWLVCSGLRRLTYPARQLGVPRA